ncbi:MAG: kinase/pyrophosphorylase [Alphaproteobacteria bacterium]|nr:kinase/pyrophosphorylase [Alphaproteobacteria bacterium]
MSLKQFHLYLISDSSGETISLVAKAVCAHFENAEPIEHLYGLVRSDTQLERVLETFKANPGPVLYSMVDTDMAQRLEKICAAHHVPCLSVLDPFVNMLAEHLDVKIRREAGTQHRLTTAYFARIEALNFAVAHDDGQSQGSLNEADIVLVGVSRTSKTPTCMYLAHRGVRAANVPYVRHIELPAELLQAKDPLIIGLTASPTRLVQIRKNRLLSLNEKTETEYIDRQKVKDETVEARRFFANMGWPVIDVTRRSIEETSAAILNVLEERKAREDRQTK